MSTSNQDEKKLSGLEEFLFAVLRTSADPLIDAALPEWPSTSKRKAKWVGLHRDGFVYTHHSSHGHSAEVTSATAGNQPLEKDNSYGKIADLLFCVPAAETLRLQSIIENSRGGSALVTGYRGTGKSSLVNYAISQLIQRDEVRPVDRRKNYVAIRINLSTSRDAKTLVFMMIKALYHCSRERLFTTRENEPRILEETYRRSMSSRTWAKGVDYWPSNPIGMDSESKIRKQKATAEEPYTLHEAQEDLHRCLKVLKHHRIIFIFDELDKLTPRVSKGQAASYKQKLFELQGIVSDLKFLLTEANAFHIFIAGKDVDDSWQEDQNKGEGLFESVFVQNIYVPSTLKANLHSAIGPQEWLRSKLEDRAREGVLQMAFKPEDKAKEDVEIVEQIERQCWGHTRNKHVADSVAEGTINTQAPSVAEKPAEHMDTCGRIEPDILIISFPEDFSSLAETNRSAGLRPLRGDTRERINKILSNLRNKHPGCRMQILTRIYGDDLDGAEAKHLHLSAVSHLVRKWSDEFYRFALLQLGIEPNAWTYNTGLIILPHLSEHEIRKIILRGVGDCAPGTEESGKGLEEPVKEIIRQAADEPSDDLHQAREPFVERHCRRLRYLLQYLTYKGRGIPRKALREFYALVQKRTIFQEKDEEYWRTRGGIEHLLYLPGQVRQKMKFFATIVTRLESHMDIFRDLDDKGCVATFHIIDYLMQYYQQGFDWVDIENANFMTLREEIFPSKELVAKILRILEGVIIERAARRQREYMLLPRVRHDLAGLYMAFGPEQIELRFTKAEYSDEIQELEQRVAKSDGSKPEERLESFSAQERLGEIWEALGNPPRAQLEYAKALRWIRMDITQLLETDSRIMVPRGVRQSSLQYGRFSMTPGQSIIVRYLSQYIEILRRLGYLSETAREFEEAAAYYEEAVFIHESAWEILNESQSLLGDWAGPLRPYSQSTLLAAKLNGSAGSTSPSVSQEEEFYKLIMSMMPNSSVADVSRILPFSEAALERETCARGTNEADESPGQQAWSFAGTSVSSSPFSTSIQPSGLDETFNSLAILLEKMWHRVGCNRFLLLALDYSRSLNDLHAVVGQMMFIGQVMMRRRDVRMASAWYSAALRALQNVRWRSESDLTVKQPEVRSTARARLYDYLGDVFCATKGTAILDSFSMKHQLGLLGDDQQEANASDRPNVNRPQDLEEEIRSRVSESFGELLVFPINDEPLDELFYAHASLFYVVNEQPMSHLDVEMKRLKIRQDRLAEKLDSSAAMVLNSEGELDVEYLEANFGEITRAWCTFWFGAEQCLSNLIDTTAQMAHRGLSRDRHIVDRRRYGVLFYRIGRMFSSVARGVHAEREGGQNRYLPEFSNWYRNSEVGGYEGLWPNPDSREIFIRMLIEKARAQAQRKPTEEAGVDECDTERLEHRFFHDTDIFEAVLSINRILGHLIGNERLAFSLSAPCEPPVPCGMWHVREGSALWALSSPRWRSFFQEYSPDKVAKFLLWPLLAGKNVDCKAEDGSFVVNGNGDGESVAVVNLRDAFNISFLYQIVMVLRLKIEGPEVAGANKAKVESGGPVCEALAKMLKELEMLALAEISYLGSFMALDDNIQDLDAAASSRSLGFLYLRGVEMILKLRGMTYEIFDDSQESFDRVLAFLYSFLHTSAKRFLVNALNYYRAEQAHERCIHDYMSGAYRALGDLMVVRSEVLEACERDVDPEQHGDIPDGLDRKWDSFLEISNNPAVLSHCSDNCKFDTRRQADQFYRDACKQHLAEIDDYMKRYRFPHKAYFRNRNIIDYKMHYDICRVIRVRHWDYHDSTKRIPGHKAVASLQRLVRRLALAVSRRGARVESRQAWLEDLRDPIELLGELGIHPRRYLRIGPSRKNRDRLGLKLGAEWDEDRSICRRFFRSFDDGFDTRKPIAK